DGNTCIDCHKGIAHNKIHDKLSEEELEEISKPTPENIRPIAPQWQAFIDNGKKLVSQKEDSKTEAPADVESSAVEEAAKSEPAKAAPATKPAKTAAASSSNSGIDWSGIEPAEVTLFFPGQSSLEWTLKGSDHGGKRPFVKGDRCLECHEDEEVDIGDLIVSGEKVEPTPIPGKRGSILVNIQAAHDADNLYMRFQWEDGEHAPVPFAEGGKMDAKNPIKLAIMLSTDSEDDPKVEYAERAGCWQTCHHDVNYMPDEPDKSALAGSRLNANNGFTKYLKESRTAIEIEGKNGKKRGGWDKLKSEAEVQALLENGSFMDLLRYKSGTGESEDGYILAERVMTGGQGVNFTGNLKDGVWTVEMTRKLTSDKLGDISMSTDQWYNIGFAIHDDYSNSRFHHVSLGLKLGFDDDEAEINAIAR
ncbi:MAG: cytochrome C552, partial [Gammaproteobacteria bacterium]|nr:cytochrome C552 [Gammaproteobacteria bacterium]